MCLKLKYGVIVASMTSSIITHLLLFESFSTKPVEAPLRAPPRQRSRTSPHFTSPPPSSVRAGPLQYSEDDHAAIEDSSQSRTFNLLRSLMENEGKLNDSRVRSISLRHERRGIIRPKCMICGKCL